MSNLQRAVDVMRVRFNRQLLGPAATICEELAAKFGPIDAGDHAGHQVQKMFVDRETLGMQRYGKPLDPQDGRKWVSEACEEIADGMVYVTAEMRLIESRAGTDKAVRKRFVELTRVRAQLAKALVRLTALEAT